MPPTQTAQAIEKAIAELLSHVELSDHTLESIYMDIGDACPPDVAMAYERLNAPEAA